MAFHLEGPWLSTSGKSRRSKRYRNSSQAQIARENQQSWNELLHKHRVNPAAKPRTASQPLSLPQSRIVRRDADQPRLPSVDTGVAVAALPPAKVYTGTKIKGIGTMHKSNAVPIFSDEQAQDIARMRR